MTTQEIDREFNAAYQRDGKAIVSRCATAREIARQWYVRGRIDANLATLRVTISERLNLAHLDRVLQAQKQTS